MEFANKVQAISDRKEVFTFTIPGLIGKPGMSHPIGHVNIRLQYFP